MKIIITPSEAIDKSIWSDICELKGLNECSVSEGLMPSDYEIVITEEEAVELGLIDKR